MTAGEFSRPIRLDRIPTEQLTITADEGERTLLASRFALPALQRLQAMVTLVAEGDVVEAHGRIEARYEQRCAIADEPFAVTLDEPLAIRFVPALATLDEEQEHEFDSDEPDEIEYEGGAIDLGEAVAQSFGLAIDPYATGPDAETARREAGLVDEATPTGPFAVLAALKERG